jgi:hypothetical protein
MIFAEVFPWPVGSLTTLSPEEPGMPVENLGDPRLFKRWRSIVDADENGFTFATAAGGLEAQGFALLGVNPDLAVDARLRLQLSSRPAWNGLDVVFDVGAAGISLAEAQVYPDLAGPFASGPVDVDFLFGLDGDAATTPAPTRQLETVSFNSGKVLFLSGDPPEGYWEAAYLAIAIRAFEISTTAAAEPRLTWERIELSHGFGYLWSVEWDHLPATEARQVESLWAVSRNRPVFFWPWADRFPKDQPGAQILKPEAEPALRGGLARIVEYSRRSRHLTGDVWAYEATMTVHSWQETEVA